MDGGTLTVAPALERAYGRWGKRLLSLVLLGASLPVALGVGLPIALVNLALFRDARRILFWQDRVGHRGRTFRIYKFRTMREVSPTTPDREDHAPEAREFHSWKSGDDGLRVTRFGRFLRSTHLDELPQLINILLGEMDFIGPRPEMVEIHRWAMRVIPEFQDRTLLRPGITGLAQVTQGYVGHDEEAYRGKLQADLEYARNLSFRLDALILLRTVVWMLMGRGWSQTVPACGEASSGVLAARMEVCSPTPLGRDSSPTRSTSDTTRAVGIPSGPID